MREIVDKNDNVVYNRGMKDKELKFDVEAIDDIIGALEHLYDIAQMISSQPEYFHRESVIEKLRIANSYIDKLIKYCKGEPKEYWYIDDIGIVLKTIDLYTKSDKIRKASGNYYNSKEEAKEELEYLLEENSHKRKE